ncbi:UDP-N-acetylglucosamine/UDP-N-acetylgalactosaminediphosphorylase [Desulfocicer vacuolatum DSM 3385]|uniref:UDP-N-acetylglucosamine/UDP-N-acetylgalactosamine diphosphorylase n=1 Tax=Desulfocicer vacuolatum DSM 3385 TaxID=1121400 RepID=A0A1W1Z6X6_9BACT|nr:protein GlmU [Desulfocicer vacuolatum]SMC44173.1 UDP-N-acetylglucosamine/UDP-N-acetylgalactosaminediphosphorylase [Desulfocicer vacuolatum DSM 3385]
MNLKNGIDNCNYLMEKGVEIPLPHTLFIGPEVDLERISGEGVTLYPGTRISGKDTLIMSGTTLGKEAPVTLDNCHVGPDTHLKGGFFQDAVFVGKNSFGSGAHVRGGTILEEEAGAAHTVGLKQTILLPFVTLGSLINFCDLLMAGGTSRKDHSEVGSSYIHFNYTPEQHKATASLLGNVHQGVMLDQPPIFLGGQGGLVGPRSLAFGTVVAAGTICRRDEPRPGCLIFGGAMKSGSIPMGKKKFRDIHNIFEKNCHYIQNLIALLAWYQQIRPLFFSHNFLSKALLSGMQTTLEGCIKERIKRLDGFCEGLKRYGEKIQSRGDGPPAEVTPRDAVLRKWSKIKYQMEEKAFLYPLPRAPGDFVDCILHGIQHQGFHYTRVIHSLSPTARAMGMAWLKGICDD